MRILLLLLLGVVHADVLNDPFPAGEGSRFELQMSDGITAQVVVSITDSTANRVGVELYFSTGQTFVPTELWQQFVLDYKGPEGVKLAEGYILSAEMKRPEKVDPAHLPELDGFALNDFLFADPKKIEALKVGVETIQVPAGSVVATHYRQTKKGQVIDYWLSEAAKPIGLVKLVSSSDKPLEQYSLSLTAKVRNLAPKINRQLATPLTEKGKALLSPGLH